MKRIKAYKTVAEGQRLMVIPMVVWSVVFILLPLEVVVFLLYPVFL